MKQKRCNIFYVIVATIILCCATPVFANTQNYVTVVVDGEVLEANGVIFNGRTLVPVRALAEALNATVEWDGTTRMVTLSKPLYRVNKSSNEESIVMINVYLWIDKLEASLNGSTVPLDVAPQIIDSITMLPARAVCEWFEASVEWNGNTNTVTVTKSANDSFSAARINNAQIELTERNVIDQILGGEIDFSKLVKQETAPSPSSDKSYDLDGIVSTPESNNEETQGYLEASKLNFIYTGGPEGIGIYDSETWNNKTSYYKLLKPLSSMTDDFYGALSAEATFNGIRCKKVSGELYFNKEDLISNGVVIK